MGATEIFIGVGFSGPTKRSWRDHEQISSSHKPQTSDCTPNDIPISSTTTTLTNTAKMGRVRTKTVKKSAKVIIERYYPKLTLDFETNKRICDEIAVIASKRLRNKVRPMETTFNESGMAR